MNQMETAGKDRATILAEERTVLAITRSVNAAERTLMAWIRTSLSMIGFGFSIYKFFQYMFEESGRGMRRPHAPRNLGLTLIALGTLALLGAAWEHRNYLKKLNAGGGGHALSISFIMAIAIVLVGVLTFCGVLIHEGPF